MKSSTGLLKLLVGMTLVLLLVPTLALTAATYYVATNGNDANPGTQASPWRTIQKAASTMRAGDTTNVRAGTYNEKNIQFANSGTSGNVITLKGYTGETAIIDAGFTTDGGDIPVIRIDGPSYITLDSLSITRGSQNNLKIGENGPADHITVQNCDISNHVSLQDNNATIYLGTSPNNVLIQNNYLHGYQQGPYLAADAIIMYQPRNVTIKNNEMYNLIAGVHTKFGVATDGPVTIQNNIIHDMSGGNPSGLNFSGSNVTATNNLIYNIANHGIQLYESAGGCDVLITRNNVFTHNTIANAAVGAQLDQDSGCEGAKSTTFRNNIITGFTDGSKHGVAVWPYTTPDGSQTTFEYNILYSSNSAAGTQPLRQYSNYYTVANAPASFLGNHSTNLQLAPIFVNASGNNYALASNSPGKNAASDGTDMGANISLVGVQRGTPGAPINPGGLAVR